MVEEEYVPTGYFTYAKFAYGEFGDPIKTYRGEDCVKISSNTFLEWSRGFTNNITTRLDVI